MSFVDYDDRYPAAFKRLVDQIYTVLPGAQVDHIGSTSVPGLGGRPVLDVVVACTPGEQDRTAEKLQKVGLQDDPYAWSTPMLTGVVEQDEHAYSVRLYVLPEDHELRQAFLATRDLLRRDPSEVARYAAVKRRALDEGHTSPWAYQEAKTPYLEELASQQEGP